MNLRYRAVVVREAYGFRALVHAFPELHATGDTPEAAIEGARREIARALADRAREGRLPPPPDDETVAVEMLAVEFEAHAPALPKIQIDVITGCVRKDGAEVPVRGATLALLVLLATEPRDVSTEALCERLYPGSDRAQAYDALKMAIYRARKQLGARGVIETTQRGYRLAESVVVDVRFLGQIVRAVRTRSLAKAIANRLETIFEQLVAGRPAAYAAWEWFAPVERILRDGAREIGLYAADRCLREGSVERALDFAQQLAALDPLDETAHELYVRVHLARGDRASALQVYRRYAEDLQAQHGMDPSPALRALME